MLDFWQRHLLAGYHIISKNLLYYSISAELLKDAHRKENEQRGKTNSGSTTTSSGTTTFTNYLLSLESLNINQKILFITDLLGAGEVTLWNTGIASKWIF